MKKKNRPHVPEGACLTLVYQQGGVDTFKRYSKPHGWQPAENYLSGPMTDDEVWTPDIPILGWVVVDEDGTVTIGPQ